MRAVASRRGFLRGIATVSAVAGTVAAPYALRAAPVEDAELHKLGADLERAGAAYLAAREAKAVCVAHYERIKPAIPADILRSRDEPFLYHREWPPNCDGIPDPKLAGNDHRIQLYDRYELSQKAKLLDGRTRLAKRVRMLKAKIEAFYVDHERARETAGVRDAEERCWNTGRAVLKAGFAIMGAEATTLGGLSVKGRAGLAMHRVWKDEGGRQVEDSHGRLLRNLATVQGGEMPLCA